MQILSTLIWAIALLPDISLAASSSGCGKQPTMKSGSTYTATANGKEREFIVNIPPTYSPDTPYRLVFTIHALGGSAQQIAEGGMGSLAYYGLPPLANDTAIFISPNGQTAGSVGGFSGWANADGEDIEFVDAILEKVEADLCVDTKLRFSTGFSYGAAMSYALACALPDKFRAVALLSGGPISGCDGGDRPIAYYQQHGVNDQILPISMGRDMRDRFVQNNGCTPVSPEPTPPAGGLTRVDYEGCSEGHPLTWVVFDGDHTPVFTAGEAEPFAPRNTWAFFEQFS